jgi:hypothetical protein
VEDSWNCKITEQGDVEITDSLTATLGELRRGLCTSRSAGGTFGRWGGGWGANVWNNKFVEGFSGLDSTLLTEGRILEPC